MTFKPERLWPNITAGRNKPVRQAPVTASQHNARREGDEFVCVCGRRWGITEARPCGDG